MGLSLRELKEYLIAKEGYEIVPKHRQLKDLKDLINDMYSFRNNNTCNGHVGTSYNGGLSLGEMYESGQGLKPCQCNSDVATSCDCVSRSGTSVCTCNTRTGTCDCRSRGGTPSCTCNTVTNCDCVSRSGSSSCFCNGRGTEAFPNCNCVNRTGKSSCTCHVRVNSCTCVDRGGTPSCTCNVDYYCNCQGRSGTPSCDCNGRCSCNAERRFE